MYTTDDDDDDDNTTTTITTATAAIAPTVVTASNGPMDAVDDKLVEWLSSCDAAEDEILHKVSS